MAIPSLPDHLGTAITRFMTAVAVDDHTRLALVLTVMILALPVGIYVVLLTLDEFAYPAEYRNAFSWLLSSAAGFLTVLVLAVGGTAGLYHGIYDAPMTHACRRADTALARLYANHTQLLTTEQAVRIEHFDRRVVSLCGTDQPG